MQHPRRAHFLIALAIAASALYAPAQTLGAASRAAAIVSSLAAPDPARAPARGLSTRTELETFMDGVMIANLRDKHVVGATISVVRDGQPFFAKGYGFADLAQAKPVDPEKTLFRIGSISKLFTWTAVMQLVESGKLALDADVNTYLDFEIPSTYPQPITLRHVMTHTAGFEEDGRDLFGHDPRRVIPLGRWLATHIPGRVRPPGQFSSYSNYASALAGYIVERVSGLPWADCIEQNVLVPLGMNQTSVRQPLPARLSADMSEGYAFEDGRYFARPWEVITGAAPAGSMSSSATDMAKFMLAHLGHGIHDGHRILSEARAGEMHARAFAHDDRLNGFALGFYEKSSHGLRIIGHGGNTHLFHSDLALIPSERLGLFVSYNTTGGHELSIAPFLTQFLDHYYPTPPAPVENAPDARAELEHIAGEYAFMRRSYTTYQKVDGLTGGTRIAPTEAGTLLLSSPFGTYELVRIGPMLYRNAVGENLFAFRDNGDEPVTYGFIGEAPMLVLERLRWSESPELHWFLLGLAILAFVLNVFAALGRAYRRRFGTPRPEDFLPGRGLLLGAVLCNLTFVFALVVFAADGAMLVTSPMIAFKISLALPVIGGLLNLGAALSAVSQWRMNAGTRGARLRYDVTVLLTMLFVWSLNVWNLLGWQM